MSGEWTGRALAALALISVTVPACGPPDDFRGIPAPQSVVPGTTGRECYYVNEPAATPAFTALARPGTRGNLALWGTDLASGDSAELSVRYADDKRILWVEAVRATLGPERLDALKGLILESMPDTARADWGIRIRVVGGDVVGTAPSVICPPRPRQFATNPPRIVDQRTLAGLRYLRGRRFPVEIRIDERGNVLGVKLLRQTGVYAVDQYLLEYVWQSSFWPKLHDGIGIPSTLEIDITIPRRWR